MEYCLFKEQKAPDKNIFYLNMSYPAILLKCIKMRLNGEDVRNAVQKNIKMPTSRVSFLVFICQDNIFEVI